MSANRFKCDYCGWEGRGNNGQRINDVHRCQESDSGIALPLSITLSADPTIAQWQREMVREFVEAAREHTRLLNAAPIYERALREILIDADPSKGVGLIAAEALEEGGAKL